MIMVKLKIMNEKKNNSNNKKEIEVSIDEINSRIKNEICYKTLNELTDESLMPKYKECYSFKESKNKLEFILSKYIDEETKDKIIEEYSLELIQPGTKGVIRGNKFNKIVEEYIKNLKLENERFEVCFEKKCDKYFTSEKPDWYILDKTNDRIIIGMNQLDLWKGGQQLNRGSKYIIDNKNNNNNKNCKLLCVVCNKIEIKSEKNKIFNLFKIGFNNDTLCYLNNLQNIIYSYFNLK